MKVSQFIHCMAVGFGLTVIWMLQLASADETPTKATPLFDGKTFAGWDGDTKKIWRIEDGCMIGGSLTEKLPRNEFLSTKKEYGDFVLTLKFKLLGDSKKTFVNSGVQLRSQRIKDSHEMRGYQADLGDGFWGSIYDESRRNKVLAAADQKAMHNALKAGQWNEYVVRAEGRRIRTRLNGVQGVDYTEPDEKIPQMGRIGLQIHGGGPAEVWFKDIMIEELPAKSR
jgi:3-keto-disaccharide hydrolase